jgi:hypothetical protein
MGRRLITLREAYMSGDGACTMIDLGKTFIHVIYYGNGTDGEVGGTCEVMAD